MFLYQIKLENILNTETIKIILDKFWILIFDLGLKIIICTLIYIVGRFLIKWLKKILRHILDTRDIDKSVKSFLNNLIHISLNIILILVIVGILGIQTTSFAAILASAGLAIGMAMKDNLSNFAGGVMILLNKPIKIGDYIAVQNTEGTVKSIGILYTTLVTSDNKTIFIPNGPLSSGNILNYSTQTMRKVAITVGVDYGTSMAKIKQILNEIIIKNPLIQNTPQPFIGLHKLNDSSIDILISVWANTPDYWSVYYYLNETIYERFEKENINIPFPQLTVHLPK